MKQNVLLGGSPGVFPRQPPGGQREARGENRATEKRQPVLTLSQGGGTGGLPPAAPWGAAAPRRGENGATERR
jgi:hypothetical protein